MGQAGSLYIPSIAYAPWQKGKVERMIQSVRSVVRKIVLHLGTKGEQDMRLAGIEAASAINARPGISGVSPAMMLFGLPHFTFTDTFYIQVTYDGAIACF